MKEAKTIEEVMESIYDRIYDRSVILELTMPNVTDFERGKHAGKIEMLSILSIELNTTDEDDSDEIKTI